MSVLLDHFVVKSDKLSDSDQGQLFKTVTQYGHISASANFILAINVPAEHGNESVFGRILRVLDSQNNRR